MEGTGVDRVARDAVHWFEARTVAALARALAAYDHRGDAAALAIVVGRGVRTRTFVFAADQFLRFWSIAERDQFDPETVDDLFLSGEPARAVDEGEAGVRPPAFEPNGAVWVPRLPAGPMKRRVAPEPEPESRAYSPGWDYALSRDYDELPMADEAVTDERDGDVLRRTPHVDAVAEGALEPGAALTLQIYCDTQPAREHEESEEMALTFPAGHDELPVQVWLALSKHLTGERLVDSILVSRGKEASTRASFDVTVVEDPPPGPAYVTAVFHYEGRTCGQVTATLDVGRRSDEPVPEDGGGPPDRPARTVVTPGAQRADLALEIVSIDGSEREFDCRVVTPHLHGHADPAPTRWVLPDRAPALVAGYMDSFTQEGLVDGERISHLVGAGMELWTAAPDGLRDVFWRLVDEGHPLSTISVTSDEWAFPWELVVPHRKNGGDRELRSPLGVEFAVGRWVTGDMVMPPQRVEVVDSYVFAPRYKGARELPNAAAEADYVCRHLNGEAIEPGDFEPLEQKFGERSVALAHFACHGDTGASGKQVLDLESGGKLEPHQIQAMPGLSGAVADRAPLVFLNACEAGRVRPALVGADGFATAFAKAGATCVIAPLWNVDDGIAHELATQLYDQLRANPELTVANALRDLRDKAYSNGGADSWAAYCFFGDPLTTVAIP
jgi:hypothetical protein